MPVISTNIAANSAVRYLNINSSDQTSSLSKLASGSRISQASDDAAGLAISTRISSDVTALTQAATNASHGISVLQTADGGASNISDILQRMKALASQSASGTVTDTERAYIDAEFSQLIDEVDGIATGTRYNGQSLLDGTSAFAGTGVTVMVGSDAADTITVSIDTLTANGLGLSTTDSATAAGTDAAEDGTAGTTTGDVDLTGGATFAADETLTITIDGGTPIDVTFSATGGDGAGVYTSEEILQAINDELGADGTASLDENGMLVITSASTGEDSAVTMSSTGTLIVDEETAVAGTAATEATGAEIVTDAVADLTVTEDSSFEINGVKVTLTATGGTNEDGVYSAEDLATAINDALEAAGNTTVTVAADETTGALTFTNSDTGAASEITIDNLDGIALADLGITEDNATITEGEELSVATQDGANKAIEVIDAAIDVVSKARANIGALESRFSFRSDSIATSIENLEAANSAITDVDVASESAKLASAKVKTQAAVAAASQASQMPEDLLKLLQ